MARIMTESAWSLKEFRLLPGYTPADGTAVSLTTKLCRQGQGFLYLQAPFVSAAMQAVTGVDMAIALALLGGIGILPVSQSIAEQCAKVSAIKRFKAGFQTRILALSPAQLLREVSALMADTGYSTFPVTDTGVFHGKLVGVLTDKDFDVRYDRDCCVAERMKTDVQVGVAIDDLKTANQLMITYGRGFLPIVSEEGTLQAVVFKKDLDKHLKHPHATTDAQKRLRVGAAISTHPEDRERVQALIEHDVDVLVIDAADGHTAFQRDLLAWLKSRYSVPVIAGNVVTAEGWQFLVDAGADAIKVGMGIGSGCITQEVKATGRGQATALLEIAAARDQLVAQHGLYMPLVADGGISSPAEMVIALALGADTLMMGHFLARYTESAGHVVRNTAGELVKEYWMEGSQRARNHRRYAHLPELSFTEGIEGHVPHVGSIYDHVPVVAQMVRAACTTAGCSGIEALHAQARLERQSIRALQDSQVHGLELAGSPGPRPYGQEW